MIPASLLVFLPINPVAGIVVAAALFTGCIVLLILASPVVEVTESEIAAGPARLPLEHVGELAAFAGAEARQERGPRLDARAWLLIRGWVDPVVRVEVTDVRDPVPYWLVSTRRPDAVVAAVDKARSLPRSERP